MKTPRRGRRKDKGVDGLRRRNNGVGGLKERVKEMYLEANH